MQLFKFSVIHNDRSLSLAAAPLTTKPELKMQKIWKGLKLCRDKMRVCVLTTNSGFNHVKFMGPEANYIRWLEYR